MVKIIKSFLFLGLLLFLSGCQLLQSSSSSGSQDISNATIQAQTGPNWDGMIVALIADMLKTPQPAGRQTLLIGDIQNKTRLVIPEEEINGTIRQQLAASSQYQIIDQIAINGAKDALGFSLQNPVVVRSHIIAEARYLGADLILLSQVQTAHIDSAQIEFELLSTRSGEILWQKSSHDLLATQAAPRNVEASPING